MLICLLMVERGRFDFEHEMDRRLDCEPFEFVENLHFEPLVAPQSL